VLSDQLGLALITPVEYWGPGSHDYFVQIFNVFEEFWLSREVSTPSMTIQTRFELWFPRLMLFTSVPWKPTQRGLALFVDTSGVNWGGHFRFQMDLGPLDLYDVDSTISLIPWTGQKETPLQFTEWGFWRFTKLNFVLYILNQLKERMVFI
jgi:hypothetical protein